MRASGPSSLRESRAAHDCTLHSALCTLHEQELYRLTLPLTLTLTLS